MVVDIGVPYSRGLSRKAIDVAGRRGTRDVSLGEGRTQIPRGQ